MHGTIVRALPQGPPLRELAAAAGEERHPWLLDPGAPSTGGRFSYLAVDPAGVLRRRASDTPLARAADRALWQIEAALDARWPHRLQPGHERWPDDVELPPFRGGVLAMLSYDLGRELERLPATAAREGDLPDLLAGVYPFVVADDLLAGRRWLLGRGSEVDADRAEAAVAELTAAARPLPDPAPAGAWQSTFTREAFLAAVRTVRERILAGDVYQVNLAQRLALPWTGSLAALHGALVARHPVPFSACVRAPAFGLVSGSPELFLRRRGQAVVSRPIKGTRPRGRDAAEDERLAAELLASPKEQAELAMIVDMVRNDLGRSAEIGSVAVELPFATERWPTVLHRVGTVRCRVPEGLRAAALVEAAFPPASVTGTPKIAAMEVIEQLEPVRRHAYTGALGWFDAGGDLELSVSIRIATQLGGRLLLPVGGGLTLESEPAAEYDETLHKAAAFLSVLSAGRPDGEAAPPPARSSSA